LSFSGEKEKRAAIMKVTIKTMDAGSRDFELSDDVSRLAHA
jgi:hypothetical protein